MWPVAGFQVTHQITKGARTKTMGKKIGHRWYVRTKFFSLTKFCCDTTHNCEDQLSILTWGARYIQTEPTGTIYVNKLFFEGTLC
jgi:hypothetical protein